MGDESGTPADIFDVQTHPSFRRRGLVKAFLAELIRRSRTEGIQSALGFACDGMLTELVVAGRRVTWRRTG